MAEATTIIAAGTVVRGNLQGTEDLLVQGAVQGSIRLDGALTVDTGARVDAAVEVVHATIHGVLVGRVVAADFIELSASAKMQGELVAPRVIIRDGALFSGLIEAGDATPATGSGPATLAKPAAAPAPARPATPVPASAPRPFPSAPAPVAAPVSAPRPAPVAPAPVAPAPVAPAPVAPAPVAPAPAPVFTTAPEPIAAPVQAAPEPSEPADDLDDDEPELPDSAAKKQVAFKKRK